MIELVAFDLDGTVLDEQGRISAASLEAVEQLVIRGIFTATISGRSIRRSQEPFAAHPDLAQALHVGAYNGAVIAGPQAQATRPLLHEERLPQDLFLELTQYARRSHLNLVYCLCQISGQGLAEEYLHVRQVEGLAVLGGEGFVHDPRLFERILEGELGPPPKVMLITGPQQRQGVMGELEEIFGKRAYLAWSLDDRVEVMNAGVDKGMALRTLARALEVPLEKVLAIGDSHNDLPMLRAAGAAVLMGNAREEVRRALAGTPVKTAPPLQEEGFAQVVRERVLKSGA